MLLFEGGYYKIWSKLVKIDQNWTKCPKKPLVLAKMGVTAVTNQGRFLFQFRHLSKWRGYYLRAVSNRGRFVLETLRYVEIRR